jgi:hypothetical protein
VESGDRRGGEVTPLTGSSPSHQAAEHNAILVDCYKAQVWSVAIGLTDQIDKLSVMRRGSRWGLRRPQSDDGRRLLVFAGHVKVSTDELDGHASPWRG